MKFIGMVTHFFAIVLLVGGPLTALIAPEPGTGQFVMGLVVGFVALAIAELHGGVFDRLFDELSRYEDERTAFLEGDGQ